MGVGGTVVWFWEGQLCGYTCCRHLGQLGCARVAVVWSVLKVRTMRNFYSWALFM